MAGSTWCDPTPNLRPTGLGQETEDWPFQCVRRRWVLEVQSSPWSLEWSPMSWPHWKKKISFSLFPAEYEYWASLRVSAMERDRQGIQLFWEGTQSFAVRIVKQKEKKIASFRRTFCLDKATSYFHRVLDIVALEEWILMGNSCVKYNYLVWFFSSI